MAATRRMRGGKRRTCKNNSVEGGRRKTRKNNTMEGGKRKASPWNKFVKKIFSEMRRKDKDASFGDALKEASKRKKEM